MLETNMEDKVWNSSLLLDSHPGFFISGLVEAAVIRPNSKIQSPLLSDELSWTLTSNIYQIVQPISADIPLLCNNLSKGRHSAGSRLARPGLSLHMKARLEAQFQTRLLDRFCRARVCLSLQWRLGISAEILGCMMLQEEASGALVSFESLEWRPEAASVSRRGVKLAWNIRTESDQRVN